MVVAVFALGAALLIAGFRALGAAPRWRTSAAYVALVAALFAPVLFGGRLQTPVDIAAQWAPWHAAASPRPHNPLVSDGVLQMLPFRALVRGRWLRGEWPFWASELGTGQPLLANAQSAPFSPLGALALPLPPLREQNVLGPWRVLVALLLLHALAAALGAPAPAAACGALTFALSPWTIAWLNHPHTAVAVFLPGVVLGVVRLARADTAAARALAAATVIVCGTAAALGGHPETLLAVAAAAAGAGALCAVGRGRGGWLLDAGLAGATVALLAAPALLPVVLAIPHGQRAAAIAGNPDLAQPPPFRPTVLATLVQPDAFGNPVSRTWRGPSNFNELSTAFAGLVPLALALTAASGSRRLAAGLAGAAVALAIALHASPFWDLWVRLPFVGHGANGRLRLVWVFAVAVLAALGATRVLHESAARRRFLVSAALVGAAAALLPPRSPDLVPRLGWLAGLGALGLAAVAALRPRWRARLPLVCAAGVLLELAAPAATYQPAASERSALRLPPALAGLAPKAGYEPFRVLALGYALAPNLGALDGIWDVRGNDPMRPAHPTRVLAARLARTRRLPQHVLVGGLRDRGFLDALGVRYVLANRARALPGLTATAEGEGWRLWESPTAARLFAVAPRVRRAREEELAHLARGLDWRAATLLAGVPGERAQRGEVLAVRSVANGFDLELRAEGEVVVASSVSAAGGWEVAVDGRPARACEVNGGFLGFSAPAGARRARLRYVPPGWRLGCGLAAAGAALLLWQLRRGASLRPQRLDRTPA